MSLAHNHHHHSHGELTRNAAIASVGMALFLLALKVYAAAETGSVALLGSLADTGFDVLASLLTLFSVRYAARPADDDHRFGHGKAEALSTLVQVMLVIISAVLIGWRAVARLGSGETTQHPEMGIGVSLVAIGATLALLAYQRSVIKKTGSVAIHGDHLHYQGDLLLNIAVIAAIALETFIGLRGADPVFGIGIALWLLYGAWRSTMVALDHLLDREWPADKKAQFLEAVHRHPMMRSVHDVRTRSSGMHDFAQFHVYFDPDMKLSAVHDVMDEVEAELAREFPGVDVLIHPEPHNHVHDHEHEHQHHAH
jgi:ferrous-iron efflux pump FieF